MSVGEAVAKRISQLLYEKGWSLYRLSKEACVPDSTLKNLFHKHTKSPTLSVVFLVADAFGLTITEFLDSPFFSTDKLDIF